MNTAVVVERVEQVVATCGAPDATRSDIVAAMASAAKVRAFLDARDAELVTMLDRIPGSFPEADIADTTGCSLGVATKQRERAGTLDSVDVFAEALDDGDISAAHVDVLTRAGRNLNDEQRNELFGQQLDLVDRAADMSVAQFDKLVRRRADALQSESDAVERLERQKRNTRVRTWTGDDGMWHLKGAFDPETGKDLARRLHEVTDTLFAGSTPDTAPSDPIEKQQHLTALALAATITSRATGSSRPGDPIVVIDATQTREVAIPDPSAKPHADADGDDRGGAGADADAVPGSDEAPLESGRVIDLDIDWGIPIELPTEVLLEVLGASTPDVVIVVNGIVLHAPGRLDLGRTTRLANRAQRRALRGLYSTCAVPGCATHYDRCKLHHIRWWRNGGRTDLDNLLPVCAHHHGKIHHDGWDVRLGPNRELSIMLPNGRTLRSGPPRRRAA